MAVSVEIQHISIIVRIKVSYAVINGSWNEDLTRCEVSKLPLAEIPEFG